MPKTKQELAKYDAMIDALYALDKDNPFLGQTIEPGETDDLKTAGSETSGNRGHSGRPGKIGGSGPSGNNGSGGSKSDPTYPFGTLSTDMDAESLPTSLQQAEDRIRNEPNEHGFVIQNGEPILHVGSNAKDYVTLDKNLGNTKLDNTVFTHNHPQGYSLSIQDGVTASVRNMAEIRAVTPEGAYSLRRTGSSWPDDFRPSMYLEENKVTDEFRKNIEKGTMTTDQANKSHYHEIWNRTAARVNGAYAGSNNPGIEYHFEPKV